MIDSLYLYISGGTFLFTLILAGILFKRFKIYQTQSKKTVVVKWILIVGAGILGQAVFLYSFYKPALISHKSTDEKNISTEVDNSEVIEEILTNQKPIIDLYKNAGVADSEKEALLYDLTSPFGVFDPISDPGLIPRADELVNFLFGYYGKELGMSEQEVFIIIDKLFAYANSFDEKKYFTRHQKTFEDVADTFPLENVKIIGVWATSIMRVDNYFLDLERKFTWDLIASGSGLYSYDILPERTTDRERVETRNNTFYKYEELMGEMYTAGIESIYTCGDSLIFILGGVTDNAFGYVYRPGPNGVNCGVLKDRFNIIANKEVAQDWRFWVAN